MKFGYLGPKNSFSFEAASKIVAEENTVSYPSIPLCIQALKKQQIDRAVVPIENSLEGSVHATIDSLFHLKATYVVGEIVLPIRQQLMGLPGVARPTKIMSHPQALAQCQTFLEQSYPKVPIEAVSSTTTAAAYVASHPEEAVFAIASKKAAQEFGLKLLFENIQDNDLNQTRFWLLSNDKGSNLPPAETSLKQTLFITLPANRPGALHAVLSAFAWRSIDLSKIESRPLKTSLGEYFFIVDLVIDENQSLINYAIQEITQLGGQVQDLGAYPIVTIG